mmetsp:Transcript_21178/g.60463  ORF Transcript_21178/g.60463 Transcript_21178/m.60463 type:complete len:95 (-) Transcript_21178:364-648(-)
MSGSRQQKKKIVLVLRRSDDVDVDADADADVEDGYFFGHDDHSHSSKFTADTSASSSFDSIDSLGSVDPYLVSPSKISAMAQKCDVTTIMITSG